VTWKCQCDCGNIHYATTENLKRGDTPSCGCITKEHRKAQLKDLTGQIFGHLTVLQWLGTINGNSKYLVKCDCGKEYEIYASNLTQGNSTSCGCVRESHGENKIRKILTDNNINFVNQKSFNNFIYEDTKGKPKYDFYLPDCNILIEYDGEQHFENVFSWDTEADFQLRQQHDKIKNEYALKNNFILIRIPYTYYNNIEIEDLLENSKFRIKGENNYD
jgi:very-short-patch-repair endonuclease